jgi:hypothetical protein
MRMKRVVYFRTGITTTITEKVCMILIQDGSLQNAETSFGYIHYIHVIRMPETVNGLEMQMNKFFDNTDIVREIPYSMICKHE